MKHENDCGRMVGMIPPGVLRGFHNELAKIAKIKSNDRMPPRTKAHVGAFENAIRTWDSPHRDKAVALLEEAGPVNLFEAMHSARRWYSGGSMAYGLLKHRDTLSKVMKLDPEDAVGAYRGFKVDRDNELAKLQPGQRLTIPVTRNGGFSSWSTSEAATNKFSGASKDKVGIIVKLVGKEGIKPVLAPPTHTEDWFNALYAHTIGTSWRPTEGEYLIHAPSIDVEVVRVKKR